MAHQAKAFHIVWGTPSDSLDGDDVQNSSSERKWRQAGSDVEWREHSTSTSHSALSATKPGNPSDVLPLPTKNSGCLMAASSSGDRRPIEQKVEDRGRRTIEDILSGTAYWSKGSALHDCGKCKPCRFVCSRTGCSNGAECQFCHLPHTDKSKNRIGMSRREYCKSLAAAVRAACGSEAEVMEALRQTTTKSAYLGSLMQTMLDEARPGDTRKVSNPPLAAQGADSSRPSESSSLAAPSGVHAGPRRIIKMSL